MQPSVAAPLGVVDPRLRGDDSGDVAGAIWRNGTFHRDTWAHVADDAPVPDAPVVLSRKRWLAERDALARRPSPLGLRLDAGEPIADIAADLPRLAPIELVFPKFSDGRAFSTARLLREKFGYTGELRAVGNVLSDQIPLMRRIGFDSFEVTHTPTRQALIEGRIPEVVLHYQPASPVEGTAIGPRPWLRRPQPSSLASNGSE
jgi:phosphoadenosine phosphosulfate reductase